MRKVGGGGAGGDHLDPPLHQRQQGLKALQGAALGRCLLGGEHAALQRRPQCLRIVRVDLGDRRLDGLVVNADFASIGLDRPEEAPTQPGHMGVQARGGRLTNSEEHAHLLLWSL